MSEELKSCPFCGNSAELISGGAGLHFVKCRSCDAAGSDGSIERAVRLWNTRTPSPQWQDIATAPGSIMLEMAAASEADQMWERRWHALNHMYAIDRCFSDRDGRWGLRDFLDYAGQVCGFKQRSVLSPPSTGGGS